MSKSKARGIVMPPEIHQKYRTIFRKVTNVLRNSTGLPVGEEFKSGALVKQTETRASDLDIGFLIPTGYTIQEVLGRVDRAMKAMFKAIAIVHASKKAVHVDFKGKYHLKVDVVPMTREHALKEKQGNRAIYQLSGNQKQAIRIIKITFDALFGERIKSYEIEDAVKQCKKPDLEDLIYHGIKFFRGRIEKAGYMVNAVYERALRVQ